LMSPLPLFGVPPPAPAQRQVVHVILVILLIPFFSYVTSPVGVHTLSLHDALPICRRLALAPSPRGRLPFPRARGGPGLREDRRGDRKSTRLNSSHEWISYAVFCLKKKKYDIPVLWPILRTHTDAPQLVGT